MFDHVNELKTERLVTVIFVTLPPSKSVALTPSNKNVSKSPPGAEAFCFLVKALNPANTGS